MTAKKCTKIQNARAERLFLLIKPIVLWRSRCRRRRRCLKPATHLAILYADRRDRRKSPSVPCQVQRLRFSPIAAIGV